MSELKTDLDILQFISDQPDRVVKYEDLKAFIGENADRRLIAMKHAHMIRAVIHVNDDGSWPSTYHLDARGEDLLAAREQRVQQVADQEAEAAREKAANDAKAVFDKKKDYRHDFKVATFTVILTLILEHNTEIVNLIKGALKALGLF